MQRFVVIGHGEITANARLQILEATPRIVRDHLWLGSGFGTFPTVYPRYARFDDGLTYLEAHDEYAQMAIETGVLGMLAILAFLAVFLLDFARQARLAPRRHSRLQRAALISALGLIFHSFIDFQFHSPANALLFFLLVALAAAAPAGAAKSPELAAGSRRPHRLHRPHAARAASDSP